MKEEEDGAEEDGRKGNNKRRWRRREETEKVRTYEGRWRMIRERNEMKEKGGEDEGREVLG